MLLASQDSDEGDVNLEDLGSPENEEAVGRDSDEENVENVPFLSEFLHILLLWSVMYNVGDNAMASLLKSLKILFSKMQPTVNSEVFLQLSLALPVSLKKAYTTFNRYI